MTPYHREHKTKEQWLEDGITYYKEQRYKEALEACNYAIQIDTTYARAHHGKGLILTQMKAYEDAKESYKQAHILAPDNAKICLDMGELFYILEDYKRSGIFYKKAVQIDSKYDKIYLDKAHALLTRAYHWEYQKCYEETIKVYKTVLLFYPNDSNVRSLLATLEKELDLNLSEQTPNKSFSYTAPHPFNCRCVECIEY